MSFTDLLEKRRSQYNLGRKVDNKDEVIEAIKTSMRLTPTGFNAQTGRLLILTGASHDKLWSEIVPTDLKAEMDRQGVPEKVWEGTSAKLASFGKSFGTILFFEDHEVVENLQEQFPLYAENFPVWSEQVTGSAQLNAWLTLTELGLGANLQHYNPVIDETVKKEFNIPENWVLRGEMLFGSIEEHTTDVKEKISDEGRFIVAD